MIRYEDIHVTYGDFVAIHNLNLHVREGELFTLLGPSGCGKTTALRTLAGFVSPSEGEVLIDGNQVTRLATDKRGIGMVFQNYALFPSMNVWENIAFGLKVRKEPRKEISRKVRAISDQVELSSDQLTKNLADLSGGQQQRVAIARALVLRPRILLMDEPLSNLDAKLRSQLRVQIKDLQEQFGITTIYVTHDQDEALSMSDRIAVFRDGRVEQIGSPEEIYDTPATEFVCNFIGDASRLGPELLAQVNRMSGSDLETDRASYVREEKVRLGHIGDRGWTSDLPGEVIRRRFHGNRTSYEVQIYDTVVKVMHAENGSQRPQVGDHLMVSINPASVLQYDRHPVATEVQATEADVSTTMTKQTEEATV